MRRGELQLLHEEISVLSFAVHRHWDAPPCYRLIPLLLYRVAAALARWPRSQFLWCIAVASALLMTRIYNFAHTLARLALGLDFDTASALHYHVDSLVTLASLVVVAVFCVWMSRSDMQRK